MNWRLPQLTRACCCLPLRRGIIAFVYLNLFLAIVAHSVFFYMDFIKFIARTLDTEHLSEWQAFTCILAFALFTGGGIAEIIMTVIALIGLHRESLRMVSDYLYYTVVYTVLMVFTRAVNFMLELWMVEVPSITIFIAFKVYYILLLRSLVEKMKQNGEEESAQVESNTNPDISDTIDETTPLVRH